MNMDPESIYEIVRQHCAELLEAASWRDQAPLPEPDADARWSSFGDERRHTRHRRRVFIARFNPNVWGDPRVPELWRDGHEESWLWDGYGPGWGKPANSSQALRTVRAGDLIVPQRNDGAGGRLLGLWVAVLVDRWIDPASPPRELWPGLSLRMATVVTHVPVVRFTREVVVPVVRKFDKALDSDQTFTLRNQNHVEVADPDGGRTSAARLLAACSLPVELLTCGNPLDLRERLARELTGMKDEHHRYWKDMQYKHELRTAIEDAAVARSSSSDAPAWLRLPRLLGPSERGRLGRRLRMLVHDLQRRAFRHRGEGNFSREVVRSGQAGAVPVRPRGSKCK